MLLGFSTWAQSLEFTLRYNIPLARYEVYVRPTTTNAAFTWGSSQISIVAPAAVPNSAFTVTPVAAGGWRDNSRIFAPTVTPAFDYHAIGSTGETTDLEMGVEKLIFYFTISGGCYDGLRLFINGSDPGSGAPGMAGGDFRNSVVNGLNQQRYLGNYNNVGTTCFPDTDGDTLTDNLDLDDDNDGILDTVEDGQLSTDTDGDGIINSLDLDSDNDGISDVDEAGGTDVNRDGMADDNDGIPGDDNGIPDTAGTGDILTGDDFDNDGRPNPYDLDSDNDAINDIEESGNPNLIDADNNGVVDGPDADGDGIQDSADGNDNDFGDMNDPTPANTDGMGGPNYMDVDSDGDGLNDIEESGVPNAGTLDANDDGMIDNNADAEGDGIPQVTDGAPAVFGDANDPTLPDNTNDGDPDYTDPNNPPVITSNGGQATASINVPENTTTVTTVTATDPENLYGTPKFSIAGGVDAGLFIIDQNTGELSFISPPNFEAPTDMGMNNTYIVNVRVTDHGGLTDIQEITVTVTNVNEPPSINAPNNGNDASISIPENTTPVTTIVATDPDAGAILTYTITGGADGALFTINALGQLSFINAPNFEMPLDMGMNNVYNVQITVSDGNGGTDVQNIEVTVTDVNEAPSITSDGGGNTATINVNENATLVTTVTATDPENQYHPTEKFKIVGGADAGLFTINANTGELNFISAPDFEIPGDADLNNQYEVRVRVTDLGNLTDEQEITVIVGNVDETGRLRVKVMLQGALIRTPAPTMMGDELRAGGYLPLNDPYTGSGNPRFTHAGSGGAASTTNAVLNANAIVDWVFVELRSASDPSVLVETRAALVQRDGDVVSPVDGVSALEFTNLAGTSYYIAIKHRNHLGAMTATTRTLTVAGTVVDFTTMSDADLFNKSGYDGFEMITIGGIKALWAGDADGNGQVKYEGPENDISMILAQVLAFPGNTNGTYNYNNALGYFSGDIDMNGQVKYQGLDVDPGFIFANIITNYTLNVMDLYNYNEFIEQLP